MRERLYFEVKDSKREILDALKNEFKATKKIPIYSDTGCEIAKAIKYDVYASYIDFWLDNVIPEYVTTEPGKIQSVSIHKVENAKGVRVNRILSIIA